MEVDMHTSPSPSTFRPAVAFSTVKRPRSPGSPSQERQTKRLTLAPVVSGVDGPQGRRQASTALDGVANQDDWVRQARELSITSPLSVTVGFPTCLEGNATSVQSRLGADEYMAVDDEVSQVLRVHGHSGSSTRPWTTTRSHLPMIHITTTATTAMPAPSPAPFSVLTESSSSSTDSAPSTSSSSVATRTLPCPPEIFLFPATPSDTPAHLPACVAPEYGEVSVGESEAGVSEGLSQASLTRSPDRGGSPRPSRASDVVPMTSGRRHRVTMGPRADCVKCRTGVRGHWMHFD